MTEWSCASLAGQNQVSRIETNSNTINVFLILNLIKPAIILHFYNIFLLLLWYPSMPSYTVCNAVSTHQSLKDSFLSIISSSPHITYHTRSSNYIYLLIPKTSSIFSFDSFHSAAADDWSNLQNTLKLTLLISLTIFKCKIKQIIVHCCTSTPTYMHIAYSMMFLCCIVVDMFIL